MEALIATKLICECLLIVRIVDLLVINLFLAQLSLFPPCEFTMTEYSRYERDGETWYSTPFYTKPGGYKLCLCVYAYTDVGYLYLSLHLMRGEYDDRLAWPFHGDFTVQLLDHIGYQNHHQAVFQFNDAVSMISRSRVTSGERAVKGCGMYFIPQIYVESATSTSPYVKNNCLTFRVTNAVVFKDVV